MKKIIEECGKNAGKLWQALNSYGPLTEAKLLSITKLREDDFFAAVGWLARENKICKNNMMYLLDETNLTNEIGRNAGKIWQVLTTVGEVDVPHLTELTKLEVRDAYSALGWLARENKIQEKKGKMTEPRIKIELK